jgi:NTP pyrophosphatase (non-canonical NTP hydrolase)
MYYLYHIPGKKIGVTRDLENRVTKQQGYEPHEFEVLMSTKDIDLVSLAERDFQKQFGYRVDEVPYNKLKFNNMNINVTEMTTTFPCPVNKLKGQLMDNIDFSWETDHGNFTVNKYSIDWIMKNVKTSQYSKDRCYVYNKAFARFYDNHQTFDNAKQMNAFETRTGALSPTGVQAKSARAIAHFDLIREWAEERGLYDKGDPKTQYVKLIEEAGEVGRAILKIDIPEIKDGIGDMVVVLTNLAHLCDLTIEECIEAAYNEIKNRKGKMDNGTFKKD